MSPHWAVEEGLSHTGTLAGGRLLVYFPDADLSDGAAEAETRGFFDVFNAPPWDTWVGFFGPGGWTGDSYAHYLLAWIPPAFLDFVSGGIYVNPEECIRWIEDSDVPLRRLLAVECPRLLWPQAS